VDSRACLESPSEAGTLRGQSTNPMERIARVLLLVAMSALGGFALPDSAAAADTAAPELVAFDFTPKAIDVTSSSKTITVTARITDETGAEAPYFLFDSRTTTQTVGFGQLTRISGTPQDGIYERTITVPSGVAPGAWDAVLYPLEDTLGNDGSFGPPAGFPKELTVTSSNADTAAPQLLEFDFTPKAIDVTEGSATVTVTARIIDATGAEAPYFLFDSRTTTQTVGFGQLTRISGTPQDGIYERTITVPSGVAPGAWDAVLYPLEDTLGNDGSFGPPAGFPKELRVNDDDLDGIMNVTDNCRSVSNSGQQDFDSDTQGDPCDSDDDGDGKADGADSCAAGELGWTSNGTTDRDSDGCRDSTEDSDDDGDGKADGADSCAAGELGWTSNGTTDRDSDGCRDSTEDSDDDGDGKADGADSCAAGELGWTSNAATDLDADGCRDAGEDNDDDGDTVPDGSDNCPTTANQGQGNQDSDSLGDVCDPDRDGDGAVNGADNCADVSNPGQQDTDGDAQGDACDPDDDGDGVSDISDACATGLSSGADSDGDGCKDANEDSDDDNDGVADADDNCRTAPAGTASGCPGVARSLTLSYAARTKKFKGKLSATQPTCVDGDMVTVWKQVAGDDKQVGQAEVTDAGKYSVPNRGRRGKYYATADARVVADVAACGAARSPRLRLG
jgi:hypothetical protein